MEPSPPPESQSQGAARFPSDISVLSSSSTTTTATGSASQTSKSRGKSRGGSRGGNKKRKGSEDAKDDPSDPDPVDDEGTRSAHILRAKNEPASYLAPTYRGIDPNRAWPNQSRNELPLFGLAVKLPLEEDAPEYKEGWHFICMASETRRKKAREGVGAVEMVEYLNPKTGKVEVKSWATKRLRVDALVGGSQVAGRLVLGPQNMRTARALVIHGVGVGGVVLGVF